MCRLQLKLCGKTVSCRTEQIGVAVGLLNANSFRVTGYRI